MTEAVPTPRDLIAFLRRAAAQLRILADGAPETAIELHGLARQFEIEANQLEKPTAA